MPARLASLFVSGVAEAKKVFADLKAKSDGLMKIETPEVYFKEAGKVMAHKEDDDM